MHQNLHWIYSFFVFFLYGGVQSYSIIKDCFCQRFLKQNAWFVMRSRQLQITATCNKRALQATRDMYFHITVYMYIYNIYKCIYVYINH
jgi:hypothetical protein